MRVRPMVLAAAGIRGVPDKTQPRGSAVRCDVGGCRSAERWLGYRSGERKIADRTAGMG
jgi:hypothetical protein